MGFFKNGIKRLKSNTIKSHTSIYDVYTNTCIFVLEFLSMTTEKKPVKFNTTALTARSQLIATSAAFFILGIVFATWASRIPAIRDIAALTPITLGYVLLAKGVGTVVVMPLVTSAIHRVGAQKASLLFGLALIATLALMPVAPGWHTLAVVLFLGGAAASGYNICINALGSKIEAQSGKSHMSKLHSWFGVGTFAGALAGTAMASQVSSAAVHFWGVALLLLIVLTFIYKYLPEDQPDPSAVNTIFKIPHGGLVWLGVICFLAAAIEESISNWVALFFTDQIGTSDGLAPIGYTAYAGSLLATRLVGDRLKPIYGAKKLISYGTFMGACGILLAVASTDVIWAATGLVMAGAGVALTFPMVFSAAGKEGPVALASVATMGFMGGMVSQPIMGYLVELSDLSGGFIFIAVCMLIVTISSWQAKLLTK